MFCLEVRFTVTFFGGSRGYPVLSTLNIFGASWNRIVSSSSEIMSPYYGPRPRHLSSNEPLSLFSCTLIQYLLVSLTGIEPRCNGTCDAATLRT